MSEKLLYALRGATLCENTDEDIRLCVSALYDTLLEKNNLSEKDIVSIIFSQTRDLNAANPAAALRQTGRAGNLSLFAVQEVETANSLPSVIRAIVHCYMPDGSTPRHVYINGAEALRPDWGGSEQLYCLC